MFTIALTNVLVTLFYLVPGVVLKKMGKAKEEHLANVTRYRPLREEYDRSQAESGDAQ